MFGKPPSRAVFAIAACAVYWIAEGWSSQFHQTRRVAELSYYNLEPILGVAICIFLICWLKFHTILTPLFLAVIFSELLQSFSSIYWNYGGGRDFSTHLSHFDSVYFSVGTLTTGTGTISAMSETVRGIQTLQMLLDLVLLVFAVAIVVTQLATYLANRGQTTGRNA